MESSAVIGYPSGQDGAIINPLLTKLVWSRWLEASFFFLRVYGPRHHKHAKKNLANIQPS